jgi:hypothetical protein
MRRGQFSCDIRGQEYEQLTSSAPHAAVEVWELSAATTSHPAHYYSHTYYLWSTCQEYPSIPDTRKSGADEGCQ